ncbi:MAG: hypothetical protein ACI3XR_06290 [Eubacteriales bacterium]
MKTNWKIPMTAAGILCSLLISHATVGLSAQGISPQTDADGNPENGRVTSQAVARALSAKKSEDSEITPAKTEIILDNEDAVLVGPWGVNTTDQLDERLGNNFVHAAGVAGDSTATATWTVTIPKDGWYQIDAWWTMHQNRATNAPYTLNFGDQSITVTVNQEQNGGVWNRLQSVKLSAGDQLTVILGNHANEYVVADGIRITLDEGIIVDDSQAVFTGDDWATEEKDCATGRYGSGFCYNNRIAGSDSNATASATFTVTAPESGRYQVYGWWTEQANRATDTPFTLISGEKQTTVRMNQQTDGATWNLLGEIDVKAGDQMSVRIENNANNFIIVDAVKFVNADSNPLYTVTVEANEEEGSVEGKCDGLAIGEVTTLTATPKEGWRFTGWYSGDELLSKDKAYTLTVTGDLTLTARFVKITPGETADKSSLEAVLKRANDAMESGVYSNAIPSQKTTFTQLLSDALLVYEQEDALQDEVDEICLKLTEFLDSPVLPDTDKSDLKLVLEYAEGLNPDDFADTGKDAFTAALTEAKAVYESTEADQDRVNTAMLELLYRTADLRLSGN